MFLEGRRRFSYPVGRLETLAASAENIVTAVQPLLVITAPAAYPLEAAHPLIISQSLASAVQALLHVTPAAAYPLAVVSGSSAL